MAQQGYWVVCEDLYAGNAAQREPTMCIGRVDGFDYVEAMGGSRMEVLAAVRRKLKKNVNFLLDCYCDIPSPAYSDKPPKDDSVLTAAYIFLGLKEVGIDPRIIEAKVA